MLIPFDPENNNYILVTQNSFPRKDTPNFFFNFIEKDEVHKSAVPLEAWEVSTLLS